MSSEKECEHLWAIMRGVGGIASGIANSSFMPQLERVRSASNRRQPEKSGMNERRGARPAKAEEIRG